MREGNERKPAIVHSSESGSPQCGAPREAFGFQLIRGVGISAGEKNVSESKRLRWIKFNPSGSEVPSSVWDNRVNPCPTPDTMTTTIKAADLIESIAAALQYISYYHPADYIAHLARAYEREQSPAAKDAIAQILTNSKMSATGQRPDLPGHRHRQRVPEGRHGRALRGLHRQPGRRHQRRRAPRLQPPRQHPARLGRGRSAVRPQEHQGQHAGGDLHRARARRHSWT